MSTFVPSTIACRCGERYAVEVANGLHISLRPDVRRQILDGTFHRFFCPACGMTTQVDTLIAFTDFPRRQWFTIAPSTGMPWRRRWLAVARESFEATMVENAPEMVAGWGREMTRRLMFGLASLREKLVTADAGLDDRVVELLKIQIIRDLRDRFSAADYFHLVAVTDDELVFERTHPDGLIRRFPVPRGMYAELAARPELPRLIELAFPDGLLIDHRAMLVPEADAAEPPDTPGAPELAAAGQAPR
ncbi:MAG TPA: CpXC domain-containing protein [Kofleriaceae bacterium]|nr:CpXC domain-containing protein [Kofleriaceae bacterium]